MKTKRLPPPLAALAALLLLLPGTAPAGDGAAPILMTPGVFALAGDAYAEDHRGAEDKPLSQFDGACRIFDRDGFRVACNESEVTLLHVPEKATIRELADFLYHEPFSKDILTRLRNGSPLTDGDLDMLDLVYEAQIEALKATVSLGYQALHFRACLNSTEAAARQKDAEFPAPTLLSRSIRNFYDLPTVEYHQLMTWGTNIADRAMDDSFRQVVTSSESKAARQMKWPALNERYYLFPHKYRESPRIHVKEKQVNRNVRMENWRNLHLDVRQQIRCLWSLYEFTRIWTEKAPPTNFKKIFIDHMTRLDLENVNVVKRAREVFYDFPFASACLEYRDAVKSHRGCFGLLNDVEGMRVETSHFVNEVVGDEMLLHIKSGFAYDAYVDSLLYLRKQMDVETYENILVSLDMKDLSNVSAFKAGTGEALWTTNSLVAFEAVETARLQEQRSKKAAEDAETERQRLLAREEKEANRKLAKDERDAKNDALRIQKEAELEKARLAKEEREREREAETERKRQEEETKRLQMTQEAEERKRQQEAENEARHNQRKLDAEEKRRQVEAETERKRQEEETKRLQLTQEAEERKRQQEAENEARHNQRKLDAEEKRRQQEIEKEEAETRRLKAQAQADEAKAKRMETEKAAREAEGDTGGVLDRLRGLFSDSDSDSDTDSETP